MPDITVLRGQTFPHPLMETQVFIIIDIPVSVNGIQVFQFVLISIIHFKFSLISQFSTYIPRESFKLIYFPLQLNRFHSTAHACLGKSEEA